jgi:hypothetical protein
VRVGDVADFKIYTEGAGEGTPDVRVIGPGTYCHGLIIIIIIIMFIYCKWVVTWWQ